MQTKGTGCENPNNDHLLYGLFSAQIEQAKENGQNKYCYSVAVLMDIDAAIDDFFFDDLEEQRKFISGMFQSYMADPENENLKDPMERKNLAFQYAQLSNFMERVWLWREQRKVQMKLRELRNNAKDVN